MVTKWFFISMQEVQFYFETLLKVVKIWKHSLVFHDGCKRLLLFIVQEVFQVKMNMSCKSF
jgi:hypothetical protein